MKHLYLPRFIREQPHLAAFALLATVGSGFGQTFFVSIFGGELREAFDLSHAAYGALYAGATVTSALLLLRAGTLVDHLALHHVSLATVLILAAGCLLIGLSSHVSVLWLAFVLIRLGGQGMMGHLAMTVAARYFSRHRGKAVALAALGFPLSEAIFPVTAVMLISLGGWPLPWLLGALILIGLILPAMWLLSRNTPMPQQLVSAPPGDRDSNQFTRAQALRDPGLYLLLPAAFMSGFIVTGMFFHLSGIAAYRGWSLVLVAGAFSGYAAGHLLGLLAAGPLVDRLGAQRFLPVALWPMAAGLLLLAVFTDSWVLSVYMGLTGITAGFSSTASGAIWAERYGIRHLGAIRSVAQTVIILSTAVSPALFGLLLDYGISVTRLALLLSGLTLLASLMALSTGRVKRN